MRNSNDVGNDLKAVAQDVLQMGARCVQAGRAWLTDRRNEMIDRNDEYRSDNQGRSQDANRSTGQQSWTQGSQARGRQQGSQTEHQQGGYQRYQRDDYSQRQPWQQGAQAGRQHSSEEYAAQDDGRAQADGQGGLEREYGRSFERGYDEGSRNQSSWDSGWQRPESSRYGQSEHGQTRYGQSRQDTSRGHGIHQGQGAYQGQGGYAGDATRQPGEGNGRSSGYGNPDNDRYSDDGGYRGTSFVSPADTQQSHSGMGRRSYSGTGYGESRSSGTDYRGVGPKNYTRSDERLTEDLCERLTQDPDIDASELDVKVVQGTATLQGSVPQRWMKHRAEDLADGCSGVRNVDNRIKVQQSGAGSMQQGGSTGAFAGKADDSSGTTAH